MGGIQMKKYQYNNNSKNSTNVRFFDSEYEMNKIPFKIYKLENNVPILNDHTHDYIQLWYVLKGAFRHSINDYEYEMVKGDLFVIPPFVVHRVRPNEGECVKVIGCEFLPQFIDDRFENISNSNDFFDFAYLEPFMVSQDMVKPKLNLQGEIQAQVEEILEEMLLEYNNLDKYYEIFLKGDLLKLLAIIIREYNSGYQSSEDKETFQKYRDAISGTIQYINEHYNEELRLDDVCKRSMMSKTYFCYIFKSLTRKTFSEYLIDLRIQKSMELLVETSMPVTEICYKIGFNDVTHFCRMFKKVVGVSPTNYRNIASDKYS